MSRRWRWALGLGVVALGCGDRQSDAGDDGVAASPPESEPPVALNSDAPIAYPPALFDQKIEGDVILRLFTDSTGRLAPESTRVAESSGYPAMDSAAVAGSAALRFAPAKRHGNPVATAFLQPVEFRQVTPSSSSTGGAIAPPPAPPIAAPPPAPPVRVERPRPPAPPPPPPQPPPPPPARPDTMRADTARADTTPPAPAPPPAPPPPPPPPSPSSGAR